LLQFFESEATSTLSLHHQPFYLWKILLPEIPERNFDVSPAFQLQLDHSVIQKALRIIVNED
jgi:hypothetical protein